ncbi:MAG: hypothetical protein D6698_16260 [Gammaproteobacteria bacterium]|nr:MAG: hypothetical protein D6698_16260 [Gammaproteobacteria bacterium]
MKVKSDLTTEGLFYLGKKTTVERNALTGIQEGSLVFDSDMSKLFYWNGNSWVTMNTVHPSFGVSRDSYNALTTGSDGRAYFQQGSPIYTWTSGSYSFTPNDPTGEPPILEYRGTANGSLTINKGTRRDWNNYTDYIFLVTSSTGGVTLQAGSGIVNGIYGPTFCQPNSLYMLTFLHGGRTLHVSKFHEGGYIATASAVHLEFDPIPITKPIPAIPSATIPFGQHIRSKTIIGNNIIVDESNNQITLKKGFVYRVEVSLSVFLNFSTGGGNSELRYEFYTTGSYRGKAEIGGYAIGSYQEYYPLIYVVDLSGALDTDCTVEMSSILSTYMPSSTDGLYDYLLVEQLTT